MEEYVFIFSRSRLVLQFQPETKVRLRQISSVKDTLLKQLPEEQNISPREVMAIRLFASGKELGDKETLRKVQVLPGMPKNLHVQLRQVSVTSPIVRDEYDSGLSKHNARLCCCECAIW